MKTSQVVVWEDYVIIYCHVEVSFDYGVVSSD